MPIGTDRHRSDARTPRYRPDRRNVLKWLGLAGTAGLAGCSSDGSDGGSGGRSVEGTYTSATSADASSLNWLTIADSTSGSYIGLTMDATWVITPEQEIFPLWADVTTDDGRVYEIELRDGLEWGAGYGSMTADDWIYMIQNVFQAQPNWSGYPNAGDWFRVNPDSGEREPIPVEKTGTRTFEVQLFEVDPSFPFKPVLWGQNCAPQGLLEKYVPDQDGEGLDQDEELNTLAYTGNLGPYTFERWDRESQYVVTRNDDYYMHDAENVPEAWTEAPYFDRVVQKVIKEESARLGALEAGDVSSAGIPPNKASRFENIDSIAVNVTPQPFVTILAYNQRANGWEPFRRKAVRQALAHAVDKEAIASNIYRGYSQVAQTMQPRWTKWYVDDEVTAYGVGDRYGPDQTRSKLSAALEGTDYSYDGDTLVDGSGEQVTLTLFFDQGQQTEQTVAEFVAQEFQANAGIQVSLKATSSFIEKYAVNQPPQGRDVEWSAGRFNGGPRDVSVSDESWDMSVNLAFNTYPYTPESSKGFFEKQGGINFYGYYPEADIASYYEQASTTTDEQKRRELFGTAFGLVNDEQPFGFLTMSSSIAGYQDEVSGYIEDFASGWDFQTWYFQ